MKKTVAKGVAAGILALALSGVAAFAKEASADKKDQGAGWNFAFKEFPIGAWWPPAVTDAEYQVYREAGFNLIVSPRGKLPDKSLELAAKYGLKVMIDTYADNDKPWGGVAGRYTPHPSIHPATLPELKWLHTRYGKNPSLAGYLLGDDFGKVPPELIETTRFLRENAPTLFPWICQCNPNYQSLGEIGNPIANPQLYPMYWPRGKSATVQARIFCEELDHLHRGCRDNNLAMWPMFSVWVVKSDSLSRFQPYSSLAYGANGLWWFTYGDSLQKGDGYGSVEEVRAHLCPLWPIAAEVNRRILSWADMLTDSKMVGVFHTGWPTRRSLKPGAGQLIEEMSDELLVGIRSRPGKPPLAVIVDKRVALAAGALPPREVRLRFASAVKSIAVFDKANDKRRIEGNSITLSLPAGGGQMVALEGDDAQSLCKALDAEDRGSMKAPPVRPDGLVLHLAFNEGKGEIADDSSGQGNEAWFGGIEWISGPGGLKGISFKGQNSSGVVAAPQLSATNAMTIATWIRLRYPAKSYSPVVFVGYDTYDRFEFGFGSESFYPVISDHVSQSLERLYVKRSKSLVPENTWSHVVIAAGPDGATTYVNGRKATSTNYAGRFDFPTPFIRFGWRDSGRGDDFEGEIADFRIWNRCLTKAEVESLLQPEK